MKRIFVSLFAAASVLSAAASTDGEALSNSVPGSTTNNEDPNAGIMLISETEGEPVAISEKPAYLNLSTVFRYDFHATKYEGEKGYFTPNTGFRGDRLQVNMNGEIANGLTYSWRQNLNRLNLDGGFFNSTDWLYLNYEYKGWNFQGGKLIDAIGGYEYDRNPADLYCNSVFWNNIQPFNFGVSVGYRTSEADLFTLQMTESPEFSDKVRNLYCYSAMWTGNHGLWKTLWSANLFEYAPDKYISYISLGNHFDLGSFDLEVDFMNRAASHQTFLLKDCSVMSELGYRPCSNLRTFAKFTYDKNDSGTNADHSVLNGTDLKMAGLGVEYTAYKGDRSSVRFHAAVFHSWGKNANENDLMKNNTNFASLGLTWRMNMLNLK